MLITSQTSSVFDNQPLSYDYKSSTQSSSPMSIKSNDISRKRTRQKQLSVQLSPDLNDEEFTEDTDEDYQPSARKPMLSVQLRRRSRSLTAALSEHVQNDEDKTAEMDKIQTCNAVKRSKRKNHRFPQSDGSTLCMYRWPLQADSPLYMLQDQLIQFLCFKSFRRKYNTGLQRRRVEPKERIYLKSKRKLKSDQVYTNSIVLNVEEVIGLLNKDFPNHCQVLSDRLALALQSNDLVDNKPSLDEEGRCKSSLVVNKTRKPTQNSITDVKEPQSDILSDRFLHWPKQGNFKSLFDANEEESLEHSAHNVARNFNSYLSERRKHFSKCVNLQTMQINYPRKGKANVTQPTLVGSFPVQLLNGQYFDGHVQRFASNELHKLPFDTINVDSDEALNKTRSTSEDLINRKVKEERTTCCVCSKELLFRPLKILSLERLDNDPYIKCSACHSISHIRCLEMSIEMMNVAKQYEWQCINCKSCSRCSQSNDEDKIMFCDRCDRGYHVYCVGLSDIPKGNWICDPCTYETGGLRTMNTRVGNGALNGLIGSSHNLSLKCNPVSRYRLIAPLTCSSISQKNIVNTTSSNNPSDSSMQAGLSHRQQRNRSSFNNRHYLRSGHHRRKKHR